jgi:hypothetical protein
MIIGIGYKSQVGKDVVGKIIQYLTAYGATTFKFEDPKINWNNYSNWQVHKFANALKDIVCILTGCSREQLEDNNFKNSYLGEEWSTLTKWNCPCNIILEAYEKDGKCSNCTESLSYELLTFRKLLQILGTDLLRSQLHSDTLVNALMCKYKAFPKGKAHDLKNFSELYSHPSCKSCGKRYTGYKRQYLCKECTENDSIQTYPSWCITDVRFPNECKVIKDREGILIKIERPCIECGLKNGHKMSCSHNRILHESETALDDYTDWDYIVKNDSTIEDLIEKIRDILIKEEIIS